MRPSSLVSVASLLFAAAIATAPANAGGDGISRTSQPSWLVTYSGGDFARNSAYFYTGALAALNRDLSQSGLVVQVFSGYSAYQYDNAAVAGGKVDGDGTQLSAMVGYLLIGEGLNIALYAGIDHQNYDLTPRDPTSKVSGNETGMRVGGDIRSTGPRHYATLEGYYSTAFESYWSRARIGANLGSIVIGPEALVLGNQGFDAKRIGGFAMTKLYFNPQTPVEVTLSGGQQFVKDDGQGFAGASGAYGALNIAFVF